MPVRHEKPGAPYRESIEARILILTDNFMSPAEVGYFMQCDNAIIRNRAKQMKKKGLIQSTIHSSHGNMLIKRTAQGEKMLIDKIGRIPLPPRKTVRTLLLSNWCRLGEKLHNRQES